MPYEVSAAADQSERLVVSVGGVSLVYGEALDSDREAATAGDGVVIVAEAENGIYVTDNADVASDLQLLQERVPEVAAAVTVEHKPDPVEADAAEQIETTIVAADPADSVVPAGQTTPSIERTTADLAPVEPAIEERAEGADPQVENPSTPDPDGPAADPEPDPEPTRARVRGNR